MTRKAALVASGLAALLLVTSPAAPQPQQSGFRVLVFTKTAGFRHGSIPAALRALRELGAQNGFTVDATEDARAFTDANLARYAVVAFVLTTGDVLDEARQAAFERYIRAGHGFVGVHSAADTEYGWAWYGRLVGAYFRSHPAIQTASLDVDRRHISTAGLPARWSRRDEWYNFATNPRAAVRVLATLDESTYAAGDGAMGRDHPIAWAHDFEGGRAWYTGGGHTDESYSEPLFRAHLLGGIRYAAGVMRPRIASLATRVRGRRVVVSAEVENCPPCGARLEVRLPGRRVTARMRINGERAVATTAALPRGRWTAVVTVENRATGHKAVARKRIRIR
jgi:cytochrome c